MTTEAKTDQTATPERLRDEAGKFFSPDSPEERLADLREQLGECDYTVYVYQIKGSQREQVEKLFKVPDTDEIGTWYGPGRYVLVIRKEAIGTEPRKNFTSPDILIGPNYKKKHREHLESEGITPTDSIQGGRSDLKELIGVMVAMKQLDGGSNQIAQALQQMADMQRQMMALVMQGSGRGDHELLLRLIDRPQALPAPTEPIIQAIRLGADMAAAKAPQAQESSPGWDLLSNVIDKLGDGVNTILSAKLGGGASLPLGGMGKAMDAPSPAIPQHDKVRAYIDTIRDNPQALGELYQKTVSMYGAAKAAQLARQYGVNVPSAKSNNSEVTL